MKNKSRHTILQILFTISLTCLYACHYQHKKNIELSKAEKLMEIAPDSSLTIFKNIQSPEKLSNIENPIIQTKGGISLLLTQIEKHNKNYVNSLNYRDRDEQLSDSIIEDTHFRNIRIAQSMFNYQSLIDEKNKYKKEATSRMIIIYQILTGAAILFIISLIMNKREKKKRKKLLALKEMRYKQSLQHIEDNKKEIKLLEKRISSDQEIINDVRTQLFATKKLMLEMENRQIISKQNTLSILKQNFQQSTLYTKINKAENALTESEWSELGLLIDATYSNFTQRLFELSQQLSIKDIHLCYLVKIGIPVKKIATLMKVTSSGVSKRRRRLYKKLTKEPESTEKLDSFISDF